MNLKSISIICMFLSCTTAYSSTRQSNPTNYLEIGNYTDGELTIYLLGSEIAFGKLKNNLLCFIVAPGKQELAIPKTMRPVKLYCTATVGSCVTTTYNINEGTDKFEIKMNRKIPIITPF